jgi:glycosyltransferase involved in cell wall biosynthesis
MRKNVLISAYTCCPETGSEPGNGWSWVMGYIENGFCVYCITSSRYKNKIESYRTEKGIKNLFICYTDNKVTLSFSKVPSVGLYIHYYTWLIAARKIIKNLQGNITFHHAHHVTYSSVKFGTPLYKLTCKSILGPLGGGELPHVSLKKYLGKYFYTAYFKNKISDFLEKVNPSVAWSVRDAEIILTSNHVSEKIISRYTDKKTVKMFDAGLSNYFERPFIKRNIENNKINILWIGRMLPRKGLNLAIDAIANLPADFNFHFNIAGDGMLKKKATTQVKDYGLQSKITFHERLPHNELEKLFSEAHVFLFPSLIDSCPMQVFEAFAFSLPVITLNHQGMKDQVSEKRGIKINVEKNINYPQQLAAAILSVCNNNEVYTSYSLMAYEFGQQQIWSKRIKLFLNNLYE